MTSYYSAIESSTDMVVDGLTKIVRMCMMESGSLDSKVILEQVYGLNESFRSDKIAQRYLPTLISIAVCEKKMASKSVKETPCSMESDYCSMESEKRLKQKRLRTILEGSRRVAEMMKSKIPPSGEVKMMYPIYVFPVLLQLATEYLIEDGSIDQDFKPKSRAKLTEKGFNVILPLRECAKNDGKKWWISISCVHGLDRIYTWSNFPWEIAIFSGDDEETRKLVEVPEHLHACRGEECGGRDPQIRIVSGFDEDADVHRWGHEISFDIDKEFRAFDFRDLAGAVAGVWKRIRFGWHKPGTNERDGWYSHVSWDGSIIRETPSNTDSDPATITETAAAIFDYVVSVKARVHHNSDRIVLYKAHPGIVPGMMVRVNENSTTPELGYSIANGADTVFAVDDCEITLATLSQNLTNGNKYPVFHNADLEFFWPQSNTDSHSNTDDSDDESERPRSECLEWAKGRAIAYVNEGKPNDARNSLLSDFRKCQIYPEGNVAFSILLAAKNEEITEDFINGFN